MNYQTKFRSRLLFCIIFLLAGEYANACTVSANSLQFGSIDPLVSTDHDSTSTVTVTCATTTPYSISFDTGGGTYAQRLMSSGGNTLLYNIYTSAAYTVVWGDGSGSTSTVSGSADTVGTDHTVYGRVPDQPTAVAGIYSDTIVVTVTY